MSANLLLRVREKQEKATQRTLDQFCRGRLPKLEVDRSRCAKELAQLIADHIARRNEDRKILDALLKSAADLSSSQVDRLNEFLQRYLELVINVGRTLGSMAEILMTAGEHVEGLAKLEEVTARCEQWREDLPDQLALATRPVRSELRDRVAKALESPSRATDWRSLLFRRQGHPICNYFY
jgi:hypothetical protein